MKPESEFPTSESLDLKTKPPNKTANRERLLIKALTSKERGLY